MSKSLSDKINIPAKINIDVLIDGNLEIACNCVPHDHVAHRISYTLTDTFSDVLKVYDLQIAELKDEVHTLSALLADIESQPKLTTLDLSNTDLIDQAIDYALASRDVRAGNNAATVNAVDLAFEFLRKKFSKPYVVVETADGIASGKTEAEALGKIILGSRRKPNAMFSEESITTAKQHVNSMTHYEHVHVSDVIRPKKDSGECE